MGDRLTTIETDRTWGGCALLGEGDLGPPSNTMSPWPRSTSLPSGILMYSAIWPQQTCAENWGCVPFGEGSWVPVYRNVAWVEAYLRGLPPYQMAFCSIQPFGHNRHGPQMSHMMLALLLCAVGARQVP